MVLQIWVIFYLRALPDLSLEWRDGAPWPQTDNTFTRFLHCTYIPVYTSPGSQSHWGIIGEFSNISLLRGKQALSDPWTDVLKINHSLCAEDAVHILLFGDSRFPGGFLPGFPSVVQVEWANFWFLQKIRDT